MSHGPVHFEKEHNRIALGRSSDEDCENHQLS